MISKLNEPLVPTEQGTDPFVNCKLDRKKYGEILTKIVSLYSDGCVLALNGEWGSGKTTFVRMWEQYLKNEGFKTLYFNVWETDYISDPLIGLVGEFKQLCEQNKANDKIDSFIKAAGKMALKIAPSIVGELAKHYLGDEAVEALRRGTEIATELLKKEFDEFENQKKSIVEFRKALTELVKECSPNKPLIFIIDELDRCNPTYAVKVLERIKHLFSIPNIVFVLSIDKQQLCHSICGFYGSDKINSEEYLKRFIDIEYNLPDPDCEKFCNFLYDKFSVGEYICSTDAQGTAGLVEFSELLFCYNNLNLRQMEKIYSHYALVLRSLGKRKTKYDENVILFLVFLRLCYTDIYISICHREYDDPQKLINAIENIFPYCGNEDPAMAFYTIALFLNCYFYNKSNDLIRNQQNGVRTLNFETKRFDNDRLLRAIDNYLRSGLDVLDIKAITDLIDLVQNFNELRIGIIYNI